MAFSLKQQTAFPVSFFQLVLRVHLRDGETETFIDAPKSSRNYFMGAFLSSEFHDLPHEDIRAHHLDFDLFCNVLSADFKITFPCDDLHLGYVFEHLQRPQNPKFIIINNAITFRNSLSILWNSSVGLTSDLSAPTAAEIHIFHPKLDANLILPALNTYLNTLKTDISSNPPSGSGPRPAARPSPPALPVRGNADIPVALPKRTPPPEGAGPATPSVSDEIDARSEIDVDSELVTKLLTMDDGDFFDDVNNIPSMMHFTNEHWLEMCTFYRDHDPTKRYYKQGHFVHCLGLKRPARPYQAYIVWYLLTLKRDDIHGCILAEGIGMGKTYETYLYCWAQNMIVAAGQDMVRSRSVTASEVMRSRHLPPGTDEHPQDVNARCPSQQLWGVQCPCIEGNLSAYLFESLNVGPVLLAVPPKLIPQWKEEYGATFDLELKQIEPLRIKLFIEHYEHKDSSLNAKNPGAEKGKVQIHYDNGKNCSTRFLILTAANISMSSRIEAISTFQSHDPTRSLWSAFFWDEFHEIRGPKTVTATWFFNQMSLRPEIGTYPSMFGLSGSPIVRTIRDITCMIQAIEDPNWLEESHEMYNSCTKNIEALAKRYEKLLKEGELLRQAAKKANQAVSNADLTTEKQKRTLYSRDLHDALLPVMSFRKANDQWFGKPIVELEKLWVKFVMVDTKEEYLPYIQTLARRAKQKADAAWQQKIDRWKTEGRRGPEPVRNDSNLRGDALFIQVRFCASFPAFAKVLPVAEAAGEDVSLLASTIQDFGLYTTMDEKHVDSTWYGKYFSELAASSQKLEELDIFLNEMQARSAKALSTKDPRPEKMIIGCSGPPVVAFLRQWFLRKRKDVHAVVLHPWISMKDRSALVRSFNGKTDENGGYENDDAQKAVVLLANMRLLSTGYNIQGANNVCIFDLPWTPDQWDQTVGRAYRSGQTREVHVKSFVALGNGIEGRIYYAFQTHQEVTELSFNITNGENEKRELAKERLKRLAYIEEKAREARQKELDEA